MQLQNDGRIKPVDSLQVCNHLELEAAARFASAVSALNTQGLGGRSGLPTLETAFTLAGLE